MRRAGVFLVLAGVMAIAVPTVAWPQVASAAAGLGATTSLCQSLQRLDVDNRYIVYNDTFNSPKQCITNSNRWANFRVSASGANSSTPEPQGFPDVYYGCSRRSCSPGTALPQPVSALGHAETSWYTTGGAPGQWDASYDLWFTTTRQTSGHPDGAEMMIWLNQRGASIPTYDHGSFVRLAGTTWYMDHWRPCDQGVCWNYVRFWRVRPTLYVRQLPLSQFVAAAEGKGQIQRSWWLESIMAGYELWRGGAGLATTWFSASV